MAKENTLVNKPPGGDKIVVLKGGYILRSVDTPAAAGSSQTDATPMTAEVNAVTAGDGTKGVQLPTAQVGMEITVKNNSGSVLKVYGATGAAINGLSANAAISMAANTCATFNALSATQWWTEPLLPS